MTEALSDDGTRIAFGRAGGGPALVVVDGALCSRAFGPSARLAARLAADFDVYSYDRRGRGLSGDTPPYSPEREIEDLAAVVRAAGGRASLLGLSSGAALALQAAAAGVGAEAVVAYEPPYVYEGTDASSDEPHEARLREVLAGGNRGAAVRYFMRDMVGAPAFVVLLMRLAPGVWRKLQAVAHTLPYDAALMTGFRVPRDRLAGVGVPTLVLNGSKTDARLKAATRAVAGAVPGARHHELAGQSHNVSPAALSAAARDFLAPPAGRS